MRRPLVVVCLLLIVVVAGTAFAGLDKKKLGRSAGESLDPSLDDADRKEARKKFTDYFSKRRAKELADVEGLSEILANATKTGKRMRGEVTFEFENAGGGKKIKVLLSVPKKYDPKNAAWPLIFCVPDKGETAKDYLKKYWPGKLVREAYLIAVLDVDYSEVEVEEQDTVKEEGDVKIVKKKVKKPFSWDYLSAQGQWWRSLFGLMVDKLKVNPNRIIAVAAPLGGFRVNSSK